MKRKAIISISSNIMNAEKDKIEMSTPGSYLKEDKFYLAEYNETEISGMEGTTTRLEIYPEKLSLIREGTTTAKMEFEKNNNYITLYNTPYGALELQIKTRELKIDIGDEGGEIFIDYAMCVSGQKPQKTELKINIKAR